MFKTITSAIKGSLVYGMGNLSIKLIGLFLFPLYTEKFTLEEYGIIGILDISSQVLVAIFGLSLSSALFRFYFDKKYTGKQGELVFSTLSILIVVAVGFVLVLSNFTGEISTLLFKSPDRQSLIRIILIASSLQVINTIPNTVLRLKEKAKLYAITNLAKMLVILVTTILFIVKMESGIIGVYYGQICGNAVYLLILSGFLLKNSTFRFHRPALWEMLAYSTPLIFSSLSTVTLTVMDRFSLNYLTGLDDVGIYTTGYKISNVLLFVVMASQLALPTILFKNMDDKNNKRLYSKVMTYNTFTLMILTIAMSVFGLEIVKVLAQNPVYWAGYMVIPFITLSILFNSMRYLLTLNLSIVKKTLVVALIVTVMSALNLGLNILLIPKYHVIGAAVSTLFTQLTFLITTYFIAQRHYRVPYEIKKLLLIILLGMGFIALGFASNPWPLYLRLIIKMALCLAFPFVLYFFHFYEKVELVRIREIFQLMKHPRKALESLKNQ
jgi:O-antigen/teichoic acid export membrane protein